MVRKKKTLSRDTFRVDCEKPAKRFITRGSSHARTSSGPFTTRVYDDSTNENLLSAPPPESSRGYNFRERSCPSVVCILSPFVPLSLSPSAALSPSNAGWTSSVRAVSAFCIAQSRRRSLVCVRTCMYFRRRTDRSTRTGSPSPPPLTPLVVRCFSLLSFSRARPCD